MKKQYTTPKTRVIHVDPSDLICTSPGVSFCSSDEEDEYQTDDMY